VGEGFKTAKPTVYTHREKGRVSPRNREAQGENKQLEIIEEKGNLRESMQNRIKNHSENNTNLVDVIIMYQKHVVQTRTPRGSNFILLVGK